MLDSSQEGEQGRETRHTVFFTSRRTHGVPKKKKSIVVILRNPEKFTTKQGWKHSQNAVYWIHLGRAQEKGIAFWQTKSHAIITNSTVPPDCIERVISQRGEMTIYQRSSTPRLAPRIVFKSAWHEQQQQQQQQQQVVQSTVEGAAGNCWRDTSPRPQA